MSNPDCPNDARMRAEDKIRATAGFVYAETLILAALPIGYGLLTYIFGDALWLGKMTARHDIYQAAFEVPWAPESWGTAFIITGALMMVFNLSASRFGRMLAASTMLCGFLFLFFSISFLIDVTNNHSPNGWPPVLVYGVVAALCANRARLAWIWHD